MIYLGTGRGSGSGRGNGGQVMPVHDWTKVGAFAFQGFHTRWIVHLQEHLNSGVLPPGYYADAEQITVGDDAEDRTRPDVVALRRPRNLFETDRPDPGGVLVEDAPPIARPVPFEVVPRPRRHVVVRHASGHRVVAHIELVSRANKDRLAHVEGFAERVATALTEGVHVLLLDLFPPGRHDPNGLHEAILQQFSPTNYELPAGGLRTFASYVGGPGDTAYVEHPAVGDSLPILPLFLTRNRYVNVPLEPSYQRAWNGTPDVWREVLEPLPGDRPQE
jgi:hypothetical protein